MTKRPNSDWYKIEVIRTARLRRKAPPRKMPIRLLPRITSDRVERIEEAVSRGELIADIAKRERVSEYVVAVIAGDIKENAAKRKDVRHRKAGAKGGKITKWGNR